MFTQDLIQATRRHLYGSDRQQLNALAGDIAGDDLTLTLTYQNQNIAAGVTLSVGLEVMYVWATNPATNSATVGRGWLGSPQSPHSAGDIITVNPRYSDWEILAALNDDLTDLSSPLNGLYQIVVFSMPAISAREGYDFPVTGFQRLLDVRWQVPNIETQEWRQITEAQVVEQMPTATFPSGTVLFLNGALPIPQQPILIRYAADLGQLGNLTDDVEEVTGLPGTALDLPPLGAAIRLTAGRPISRANTTTQGDTRRAAEVSTNDVLGAPGYLRQLRQMRLAAESARLAQVWPFQLRSRDVMGLVRRT